VIQQRYMSSRAWAIVVAGGLLGGCAQGLVPRGEGRLSEAGQSTLVPSAVRNDPRVDQRAYYAYSMSVWAELQGDPDAAVRWGQQALKADPTSVNLRIHLASLYLKKGDFHAALLEGEEVLNLAPNHVQAHLVMAAAYQGLRNVRGAEKHYREVIRLEPRRSEAYLFLGNLYLEARNLPEAIQVFEALAKADPNGHLARYSLGRIYLELKEPEKARQHFQAAIERNDDFDPAWVGLAATFEVQGRYEEAARVYERALADDPQNREFRERLAQIHLRRGDLNAALVAYEEFGRVGPDNLMLLRRGGQI